MADTETLWHISPKEEQDILEEARGLVNYGFKDVEALYARASARMGAEEGQSGRGKIVTIRSKNRAIIEFVGLCSNPAVKNEELEWFVREMLLVHMPVKFKTALVEYVKCRNPGGWFWDWWKSKMLASSVGRRVVEWDMINMYAHKNGVEKKDIVAIIGQYQCYRTKEIYIQDWASTELCRKWLKKADRLLRVRRSLAHYDINILARVYDLNHDKAMAIVDGSVLGDIMSNNLISYSTVPFIEAVLNTKNDGDIIKAIKSAHPVVWNNAIGLLLPKIFTRLRPEVQAGILSVASVDMKHELMGSLVARHGIRAEGGDSGDIERRGNGVER